MRPLPQESLSAVAAVVPGAEIRGDEVILVQGVAFDARRVEDGALFFCVPGSSADGHSFAAEAVRSGAAALVVERWLDLEVPQVLVPSVREAMGPMSAAALGRPASGLTLVGITGTNGKTTVVHLLDRIFREAGLTTGTIGTVGGHIAGEEVTLARTTPEAPDLHGLFARMRDAGVSIVAMEVSSHALEQRRVGGVVFDVGVFTNLSQDHLDHHGSMEAYFAAKASLFQRDRIRHAVVNVDDPWGRRLMEEMADDAPPTTTFGLEGAADVRATDVRVGPEGIAFRLDGRTVGSPLRGAFNASNVLAAIVAATTVGIDVDVAVRGVAHVDRVAGRMEPIDVGQDFLVVVDYAHTPDSIRTVLAAARPLATGRVIVVFGCGGDRDRAKRFPMGAAATEGADLTVITTDNPRSEDPQTIIAEVERGAAAAGGRYVVEPDRRAAVRLALEQAHPGDVVVVAGKGHETEQEWDGRSIPFDDRVVVREELEAMRNPR